MPFKPRSFLCTLFFGLAASALSSCMSSNEGLVRRSAAEEFRCDERAIRVVYLGHDHYQATGCGKRERYAFHSKQLCPTGSCPLQP